MLLNKAQSQATQNNLLKVKHQTTPVVILQAIVAKHYYQYAAQITAQAV